MRLRTWRPVSSAGHSETNRDRRLGRVAALALIACCALAWQAQAALATSGTVTVVKVNDGGSASDEFSFTTNLDPARGGFTLAGGGQQTFKVECNASSSPTSCQRTSKPVLQITEQPAVGYDLTDITCRHRLDGQEPTSSSAIDPDTSVSGATIDFKVFVKEWVKCWVTNTPQPPSIAVDKTGPVTATAGDLVPYTLQVSNPGAQPFAAATVVVSDPLCQAAPALTSVNGDPTPDSLDPGDTWTYACSVQTQVGQTQVVNPATAQAVDRHGQGATSTDEFTTTLTQPGTITPPDTSTSVSSGSTPTPAIQVLPVRQTPGSAQLQGPRVCTRVPAVQATVTGRHITGVTFYLDGKRVRTLSRADARGRWTLSARVRSFGTHRVRAVVRFTRESGTEARTLRLSFSRCRAVVARPQFTG